VHEQATAAGRGRYFYDKQLLNIAGQSNIEGPLHLSAQLAGLVFGMLPAGMLPGGMLLEGLFEIPIGRIK
jgi:hypothetical protein